MVSKKKILAGGGILLMLFLAFGAVKYYDYTPKGMTCLNTTIINVTPSQCKVSDSSTGIVCTPRSETSQIVYFNCTKVKK